MLVRGLRHALLLTLPLLLAAQRGGVAGGTESGGEGGGDVAGAESGGEAGGIAAGECSPPFELDDPRALWLRLCWRDRVEIVGDAAADVDVSAVVPAVLVGKFHEAVSTDNTHFYNVGGEACDGGGAYEAEAIFTCCLIPGEPARAREGHVNSVMTMGPCFFVLEVCSISVCSAAAHAAHTPTLAPPPLPSDSNDEHVNSDLQAIANAPQIESQPIPDNPLATLDDLIGADVADEMVRRLKGLLSGDGIDSVIPLGETTTDLRGLLKNAQSQLSALGLGPGKGKVIDDGEDLTVDVTGAVHALKEMLLNMVKAAKSTKVPSSLTSSPSASSPSSSYADGVESLAKDPQAAASSATAADATDSTDAASATAAGDDSSTTPPSSPPPSRSSSTRAPTSYSSDDDFHLTQMTESERLQTLDDIRDMFSHAYDSYMHNAFPMDELAPLTCTGTPSSLTGGGALTLVDALDTLVVMGNYTEFAKAVRHVESSVNFDVDLNVSVFETTIRVLGGLISGHIMAVGGDADVSAWAGADRRRSSPDPDAVHAGIKAAFASTGSGEPYSGRLLSMAVDVANRMIPAFETVTGIPIGTVNLRHGVPDGETPIASTAGGGSLYLEFGMLSLLTGNSSYAKFARQALLELHDKKSDRYNLVGMHINTKTGQWTEKLAGIGSNVDSFFEYLLKAYVLFGDAEMYQLFNELYDGVLLHLKKGPWYVDAAMATGKEMRKVFNNLQAFWPGLQTMIGDAKSAASTLRAFHLVRQSFGFTPENFHFKKWKLGAENSGANGYPLRPELAESTYLMHEYAFKRGTSGFKTDRHKTSGNASGASSAKFVDGGAVATSWLVAGREMVQALNRTRVRCGFASVADIGKGNLENHMPSFFLSETLKYLYLSFDFDNPFRQNRRNYVLTTEAHIFPLHLRGANPQEAMRDLSVTLPKGVETKTSRSPQTNLPWNLKCSKMPWWEQLYDLPYLAHVGANTVAVQRTGGGTGVAKATSVREARLQGDISNIAGGDGDQSETLLFHVDGVGEFEVTPFAGGFSVLNRLDGTFLEMSNLGMSPIIAYMSRSVVDEGISDSGPDKTGGGAALAVGDDGNSAKVVASSELEQTANRFIFGDGTVRDCSVRRIYKGGSEGDGAVPSRPVPVDSGGADAGQYIPCSPAAFGSQILQPFGNVEGLLYVPGKDADVDAEGSLFQGCTPYVLPPTLLSQHKDVVVLAARGGCTFERKVWNAEQAGAVAVIVSLVQAGENPFVMAGGGELFATETPELAAQRAKSVPPSGRASDAEYDPGQTTIPAVMIDFDSASELRESVDDLSVFVLLSDDVVPESVDLLKIDMNMTEQVGMRAGSKGVEHVVSGIRAVGPSGWGMNLSLTGPTWELGIFQSPEPGDEVAKGGGV